MTNWIALFRGINVGGRNKLPMKELRMMLEDIGCSDVRTYIQSGNVVFRKNRTSAAQLALQIGMTVLDYKGFEPKVFLLTAKQLEQALVANPFPVADTESKALHLFFLSAAPNPEAQGLLEDLKTESEDFRLTRRVFYLHAPRGIGRSKLAAQAERILGGAVTARNWRTASRLLELAGGGGP